MIVNILKKEKELSAQLYQIVNNRELWNTDQSSLMLHGQEIFSVRKLLLSVYFWS